MQLKIDMNHFYNNNNKYLIIKLTLYLLHFIEPRFSMEHDSKSVSNEQEYNTKTSSKKNTHNILISTIRSSQKT